MATNKERLDANNEKIREIQETLKNKVLPIIGGSDGEYFVKVIDYDGTILKEANLNTGDTFTLPSAPSHDGLVFQEWSCSQEIVDNTITIADNNVMVGAVYTTASGLSEFDIELTKVTGLDVTLNMNGTKDWGDGTSDDLTTHTYANYGKYTIKCNGTTMNTFTSSGLFGQSHNLPNYYCVSARFNNITRIGVGAFSNCRSLTNITTPNTLIGISTSSFNNCYSLTSIVIPNSAGDIAATEFYNCYSLTSIVIQNSANRIYTQAFSSCYSLTNIAIPNNVTTIDDEAFNNCYSLISIKIPNNVTSIASSGFYGCRTLTSVIVNGVETINNRAFYGCYSLTSVKLPPSAITFNTQAFYNCYSITIYDFSKHTVVPTLSDTNAFTGINAITKIIVPDGLYNEWIVATNWATYADYIYKASEVV